MPSYEECRSEVDRLFPKEAARVALRSFSHPGAGTLPDEKVLKDISEQLGEKIARDAARYMNRVKIKNSVLALRIFDEKRVIEAAYVSGARPGEITPGTMMNLFAQIPEGLPLKLDFSTKIAKSDTAVMESFIFYHELAHGISALLRKNADYYPEKTKKYIYRKEEAVCDAFATLAVLNRFGEMAKPTLYAIAEARLIFLERIREQYLTSPSITAAMSVHDVHKESPAMQSGRVLLALAEKIASNCYPNYSQSEALTHHILPGENEAQHIRDVLEGYEPGKLRPIQGSVDLSLWFDISAKLKKSYRTEEKILEIAKSGFIFSSLK